MKIAMAMDNERKRRDETRSTTAEVGEDIDNAGYLDNDVHIEKYVKVCCIYVVNSTAQTSVFLHDRRRKAKRMVKKRRIETDQEQGERKKERSNGEVPTSINKQN